LSSLFGCLGAPSFMFTSGVLLHRSMYSYLPKRKTS